MRAVGQQLAVEQHIARGRDVDHPIALNQRGQHTQVTQVHRSARTPSIDLDTAPHRHRRRRASALACHDLYAFGGVHLAVDLDGTRVRPLKLTAQHPADTRRRLPGTVAQHAVDKRGGWRGKHQAPAAHPPGRTHRKTVAVNKEQVATLRPIGQPALQLTVNLHPGVAHHIHQPVGPGGHHQPHGVALAHLQHRQVVEGIAVAQGACGHGVHARLVAAHHRLRGANTFDGRNHRLRSDPGPVGAQRQCGRQRQRPYTHRKPTSRRRLGQKTVAERRCERLGHGGFGFVKKHRLARRKRGAGQAPVTGGASGCAPETGRVSRSATEARCPARCTSGRKRRSDNRCR